MIENDAYEFLINRPEYVSSDTLPIRILKGKFKDVEFRFERITLTTQEENLKINFDVDLLKTPDGITVSLSDQELIDLLGEILYDIIVNREDINADVFDKTEPVDLEADVHEEPYGKDHS